MIPKSNALIFLGGGLALGGRAPFDSNGSSHPNQGQKKLLEMDSGGMKFQRAIFGQNTVDMYRFLGI